MNDKECCETCKWWHPNKGICLNERSDNMTDYTHRDFLCDEYEREDDVGSFTIYSE